MLGLLSLSAVFSGKKHGLLLKLGLTLILLFYSVAYADGYTWLNNQQQSTGELVSQQPLATAFQATNEVIRLHALSQHMDANALSQANAYLADNLHNNTEYLARFGIAQSVIQYDPSTFLDQVQSHQGIDGGVGDQPQYQSTLLNSAYALMAFAVDSASYTDTTQSIIDFVLPQQQPNGAYGAGDIYTNALLIEALWSYRHQHGGVMESIENAKDWLLSQKGTDNLWGEDFISAQVLIALIPTEYDNTRVQASLDALKAAQLSDGSWQGDVFTTAKALRVEHLAPLPKPDHAGMSGQILDAESLVHLGSAQLSLSYAGQTTVSSADTQGHFHFYPLTAGIYDLQVDNDGYDSVTTRIELSAGEQLELGGIKLLRDIQTPPEKAVIQGSLTNQNGQALADVQISLNGVMATYSNASGDYRIQEIEPGEVTVQFSKMGYQSEQTVIQAELNQTLTISARLFTQSIATSSLSGTILDKQTLQPLAGVQVQLEGANSLSVTTDANGFYEVLDLAVGSTTVSIAQVGYHDVSTELSVRSGTRYRYSPQLMDLTATPEPQTSAINGRVVDGESQQPIAGVLVQLDSGESQLTDSNGQFTVSDLHAGDMSVTLSENNYRSLTLSATMGTGLNVDMGDIQLTPQVSEYAFSVVVVDSLSNQPLANVQLLVSNTDNQLLTLTSDDQGVIQAGPLSQPLNQLQVSLSGYYAVDFDVLLAPVPLSDLGQIRLRPLAVDHLMPDLVVSGLDTQALVHDAQTLQVSGELSVEISNLGNSDSGATLSLLAFSDNNHNQSYEVLEDTVLGELQMPQSIPQKGQATVVLPIAGQLPFRDAPISVWVDSENLVIEKEEGNNIRSTAQSCIVEPLDTDVAFKPKLKWHWHSPTQNPQHHQILTTPVVAQLNDDNGDGVIDSLDIPDVVVNTFNGGNYYGHGYIRALSGADGSEIWPAGVDRLGAGLSGPAVGDIDNDGTVEIVTLEREGYGKLVIYAHDGTVEGYIDSVHVQNGYPMLVDLDNDGQTEIVVGGQVFNPQGDLLWEAQRSYYADESTTLAFDHDLDGSQEILVEGRLYDHTGQVIWDNGIRGTYAAVGNFDADDYPEIVYKKEWGLYLLEHTGEVKWGPIVIPGGGGGPLTIADMDGDKEVEIGMAGKSQYIVFETDGSIKWTQATDDPSGRTGSSVFDFEGDGAAEILYSDEHYFRVYQGETGQVLLEEPNPSATWFEYPLVVDVDNDGHAEIILVSNNYKHSGPTGVRVFENETDDWMATRTLWNQYHYRITNILDDGRIPTTEEVSWLVHNTFRLNTIVHEDILSLSDLTAAQLTTQTDEQGLNLSLLIGNAGMTENSEGQLVIYQDSVAGQILASIALPMLAPGTSQTLNLTGLTGIDAGSTLIAHIDPDGQLNECQTQNNQVQTLATGVNGAVQLALDKSEYTDNETVQMNATLTNTGIYTADYQVQWRIESTQGALLTELSPQTIDGLAAQSNQTLQQNWETGQTLSGDY